MYLLEYKGCGEKRVCCKIKEADSYMYKTKLVCLIEPMNNPDKMSKLAITLNLPNFIFNSLAPRKLWLFWYVNLSVVLVEKHPQAFSVDVSLLGSPPVCCTFVYTACDVVPRRELVDAHSMSMPWSIT